MGSYNSTASFEGIFRDLQSRLSALERTKVSLTTIDGRVDTLEAGATHYTNATRPDAGDSQGLIIFNTDTLKHEGSDGTLWQPLY